MLRPFVVAFAPILGASIRQGLERSRHPTRDLFVGVAPEDVRGRQGCGRLSRRGAGKATRLLQGAIDLLGRYRFGQNAMGMIGFDPGDRARFG